MFMSGYFYWSGVVINAIVVFWIVVGAIAVAKQWYEERKIRKKYARKEVGGKTKNDDKKK